MGYEKSLRETGGYGRFYLIPFGLYSFEIAKNFSDVFDFMSEGFRDLRVSDFRRVQLKVGRRVKVPSEL